MTLAGRLAKSRLARRAAAALCGTLAALSCPDAVSARTLYFPHQDARFLYRFQHDGGAAVVPDAELGEQALPLVVFLHGTNPSGEPHMWLGGGGRDLRPLVKRVLERGEVKPFVLAAPSHTRNAGLAFKVWQGFDLNAFVDDVVQATNGVVKLDREQVVLVGHSGAGCNPEGGLAADFWSAGVPLPLALVSIDPCLDGKMGGAFARRPTEVPLLVWWQPAIWLREPAKFEAALNRDKPQERIDRLRQLPPVGNNPHEAILPVALESALRELLGRTQSD